MCLFTLLLPSSPENKVKAVTAQPKTPNPVNK
nr:MAG TPA: hypothetical protein [Caudoviricetes sp.]